MVNGLIRLLMRLECGLRNLKNDLEDESLLFSILDVTGPCPSMVTKTGVTEFAVVVEKFELGHKVFARKAEEDGNGGFVLQWGVVPRLYDKDGRSYPSEPFEPNHRVERLIVRGWLPLQPNHEDQWARINFGGGW